MDGTSRHLGQAENTYRTETVYQRQIPVSSDKWSIYHAKRDRPCHVVCWRSRGDPFLLLVAAKDNWHKGVKILIAILALAVCYSRVVLGAHYVSDVLAGIGMALICFPLVMLINIKMLSRMTQVRLNFAIKIWGVVLLALMIFLIVN